MSESIGKRVNSTPMDRKEIIDEDVLDREPATAMENKELILIPGDINRIDEDELIKGNYISSMHRASKEEEKQ